MRRLSLKELSMKSCQRCGGNLLHEDSEYFCIQCGCEHDYQGNRIIGKVAFSANAGSVGKAGKDQQYPLKDWVRWQLIEPVEFLTENNLNETSRRSEAGP